MWKIDRKRETQAIATAHENASINTLARIVEFDPIQWNEWLRIPTSTINTELGVIPSSELAPDTLIVKGEQVFVPNTVLAYWAGELGWMGKCWVLWEWEVETLKKRGYKVLEKENWYDKDFTSFIKEKTLNKELVGLFFWGHGNENGVMTVARPPSESSWKYWAAFYEWRPRFDMAVGILFSCHSSGGLWLFHPGSATWGSEGYLIPWPCHLFAPPICKIIPPGRQGTKRAEEIENEEKTRLEQIATLDGDIIDSGKITIPHQYKMQTELAAPIEAIQPDQLRWHKKLTSALIEARQKTQGTELFTFNQLLNLIEEDPDHKVPLAELSAFIRDNSLIDPIEGSEHFKESINRVLYSFGQNKQDSLVFDAYELIIYVEKYHFKEPAYRQIGYQTYYFINIGKEIRGGSTLIVPWK